MPFVRAAPKKDDAVPLKTKGDVFHHRHSVRGGGGAERPRFRKEKARLLRIEAKDHKRTAHTRRWRLCETRDGVRVFTEEALCGSPGCPGAGRAWGFDLAARSPRVAAALLPSAILGAAVSVFASRMEMRSWVSAGVGTCGAALAVTVVVAVLTGALDFLLYADLWRRTGRVRADVRVAAAPAATFAFLTAPDPNVRREWSMWFEHSVTRTFDAHTALVDMVEISPPGWIRLLGSRPRISRTISFWSRDGDCYSLVAADATGTEEGEGNALPEMPHGVRMAVTQDTTDIRPAAFGGGSIVTRVVDCDAKLAYGLTGRRSAGALAWHRRRVGDDLLGLKAACASVVDDSTLGPNDERRSHFNFGAEALERAAEHRTKHTTARGSFVDVDEESTDLVLEAEVAELQRPASRAPSDHPLRPAPVARRASVVVASAFREGSPGCLPRRDAAAKQPWGAYGEPNGTEFRVRGPNYLVDKKKVPSAPQLCELAGIDALKCKDAPLLQLGKRPGGVCARLCQPDRLVLIINFVLPTPTYYVSMAAYFVTPPPSDVQGDAGAKALRARLDWFCAESTTDAERDDVLKIVPRLVDGPWVARHAVGQKPALLGHAIKTQYSSGEGWFEMDVDVSSSSMATGVLRILKSASKALVMDLAFVLEGQKNEDLPECVLGALSFVHFDLDPDNSPCIKTSDPEAN